MTAYLFMWNPERDQASFRNYDRVVSDAKSSKPYETKWICQSGKPQPGDVAFIQRTGAANNGIFGRGIVTASTKPDGDTKRLRLKLTEFLPIGLEIPRSEIFRAANYEGKWAPQASGIEIPATIVAALESVWAARPTKSAPASTPSSSAPKPSASKSVAATPSAPQQKPVGVLQPSSSVTTVTTYARDPSVRSHVLARAAGRCECCLTPAPFIDVSGSPFLEVHHLIPLAKQGPDTIENTTAVCPNCHRALHHGRDSVKLARATQERVRANESRSRS